MRFFPPPYYQGPLKWAVNIFTHSHTFTLWALSICFHRSFIRRFDPVIGMFYPVSASPWLGRFSLAEVYVTLLHACAHKLLGRFGTLDVWDHVTPGNLSPGMHLYNLEHNGHCLFPLTMTCMHVRLSHDAWERLCGYPQFTSRNHRNKNHMR